VVGFFLLALLLLAVASYATWQAVRVWRGDEKAVRAAISPSPGFPTDGVTQRGVARGTVLLAAQAHLLLVVFVGGVLGMRGAHPGEPTPGVLIAAAALAAFLVSFGLLLSIVWFNRPKFLVPPGMRDEIGIFQKPRWADGPWPPDLTDEKAAGRPGRSRRRSRRSR
jgi:hypothetical protein